MDTQQKSVEERLAKLEKNDKALRKELGGVKAKSDAHAKKLEVLGKRVEAIDAGLKARGLHIASFEG